MYVYRIPAAGNEFFIGFARQLMIKKLPTMLSGFRICPYSAASADVHSPLPKVSANARFPDLETEGKDGKRMDDSMLGLKSARESNESNDKSQILIEMAFCFSRDGCFII